MGITMMGIIIAILAAFCIYLIYYSYKLKCDFIKREEASRRDAVQRSRDILEGKIYEQLAPLFPSWVFDPSDAKFIGIPLDYIIFSGLAKGEPCEIIFVEVKTGNSQLTRQQRKLKKIIDEGKVRFELLRL